MPTDLTIAEKAEKLGLARLHVYYDADRDALLSALTHARKVLHGQ